MSPNLTTVLIKHPRFRTYVAHRGHPLPVAQHQHLLAADDVHGKLEITNRQGPRSSASVRVPWVHVDLLLDTRLYAGIVRNVETQTRCVDEKLTGGT